MVGSDVTKVQWGYCMHEALPAKADVMEGAFANGSAFGGTPAHEIYRWGDVGPVLLSFFVYTICDTT